MVLSQKLTAETLLGAPRRGPAVPNRNGTLALYTMSTHTFGEQTLKEVRVMNIESGHSEQLSTGDNVHDVQWIPGTDDDVLYLETGDKGHTRVRVAKGGDIAKNHYVAAELDAPVSTLKLKALGGGEVAFVVAGLVGDDGTLFNQDTAEKKKSTGRVFDSICVRAWNELYRPHRYALWYNKLVFSDGAWTLAGELFNLVKDIDVDAPHGMYDVEGALGNFDICHEGVAFVARDLAHQPVGKNLATSLFFAHVPSFAEPPPTIPRKVSLEPGVGFNVRVSPDASHIALLHAHLKDIYHARLYLASIDQLDAFDVFSLVTGNYDDEYEPPTEFEFAGSSDSIILQSQKHGRSTLAHLKLQDGERPKVFLSEGTVVAYHPLKGGDWDTLLVSGNNLLDSSLWQIVSVPESSAVNVVSSATKSGLKYGLSLNMVDEFWFEGADGLCIHSFLILPSDFDETKKYPWVLMPHGGPVSAWTDSWSTRWNMASWAEQGYIIVNPNISGSTGYGIDFAKRIDGEWGGKPFQDLLNLTEYLEKLPYLDQDKAVLAGASYGGYMVSWFMGHDIINKFCCAIWHDGIYSIPSFFLQTDFIGIDNDFKGSSFIWENPAELEKWNPAKPELLKNWKHAPPTLVIASEKDYRCPITEGLACFYTLQAQGVPSRFLTFPDECHWVLDPENSLLWHQTVWDWVKRCVDGELTRRPANVA